MNKRQVLILWVIAVALAAAVAAVKLGKTNETKSATARSAGETLLPSFPAPDVSTIEIKGANTATTIVKKDGKWVVSERDNYPAKNTLVNELLRTIGDLKVTQGMQAGPSFAARFGMDETSKNARDRGITTVYKDASGKELAQVTVGKVIESGASSSPQGGGGTGHFVRNHADESGFYAVNEMFSNLSDWPQRWLDDEFLKIEKIQSISVTQPGKSDLAWKVVRNDENSEFAVEGGAAGEAIDAASASALKTQFAFGGFEDIVPAAKVESDTIADQKRIVTIVTFEGFTYTITLTPKKPGTTDAPQDSQNPMPPEADAFALSIQVTAEIPKERKKEEGEKPEDAKTKDEAFATRSKELNEKLAKDKSLAGYTYQVGKSSVENLIKDRATLTKKPDPAAEQPGGMGGPGGPQGMPTFRIPQGGVMPGGRPIEAVTPPVTVQPTADPNAEKPAEEAPKSE
jgi:hypothetical protein